MGVKTGGVKALSYKNAKISARYFIFNYSYSKKQPLYKRMRVGLNDKRDNQKLENKWVISSYEIYNSESGIPLHPIAQLQEVGLEPSKLTST